MTMTPLFIESGDARLFALRVMPRGRPRGAFVYVPPFCEEMNRCRAVVARQARAFAEAGYACLIVDLFGTGESEGELEYATWALWQRNVLDAADHLAAHSGCAAGLWGFRLGALLAATTADTHPGRVNRLLLWQPVTDGKVFVTQYLRQRVAYLMSRNLPAETTDDIHAALAGGAIVEVAGYALSGPLVASICAHKLGAMKQLSGVTVNWFEHVAGPGAAAPPSCQRAADALRLHGAELTLDTYVGAPIWQLHKRDDAPNLIELTTARFLPP